MATLGTNMETRRSERVNVKYCSICNIPVFYDSSFAGVFPRMFGIGLGGFIFFGAYEKSRNIFSQYL